MVLSLVEFDRPAILRLLDRGRSLKAPDDDIVDVAVVDDGSGRPPTSELMLSCAQPMLAPPENEADSDDAMPEYYAWTRITKEITTL